MRAALAVIVVSCLFAAAFAQSYGGDVTCGDVDFSWRWGNYTQKCGCTNVTSCQAQLCLANVEAYTEYDTYTEKWQDCIDAYYAVNWCDGDSETSEANQVIAGAVTESYDYCSNDCNDWAFGYWTAGWEEECHCADDASAICTVANCDHVTTECSNYKYKFFGCIMQDSDLQTLYADALPLDDCYDFSSSDFCNGDYLAAAYQLWYWASPACNPDGEDYDDDACTRLTCGDITNEQYQYYDNIWYCDGDVVESDPVNAAKVTKDYERYSTCNSLPDCTDDTVTALLAAAVADCGEDICTAYVENAACMTDVSTGVDCLIWGDLSADSITALSAWLAPFDQCAGGETSVEGSTAAGGETSVDSVSGAVDSVSGAVESVSGDVESTSGASSSAEYQGVSSETGLDTDAASTITVGVAALASVVLLL